MPGSSANDFRVAVRSLLRSSGFFLTAVLRLALGMSAATIVFSAINAILLRPLPVRVTRPACLEASARSASC